MTSTIDYRPPLPDELPKIHKIVNNYFSHLGGYETIPYKSIQNLWVHDEFDLLEDAIVAEDEYGNFIAYAHLLPFLINDSIYFATVYDHQLITPTIMEHMVEYLLARIHQTYHQQDFSHDIKAIRYADKKDDVLIATLQSFGFELQRPWWQMLISLSDADTTPNLRDGLEFVPFNTEADAHTIYQIEMEVFQDHFGNREMDYEMWKKRLMDDTFNPKLWVVAKEGDEIVGFSICTLNRMEMEGLGWVRVLGVRKAWRGQGIAKAIMTESFRRLKANGMRDVGLRVDAKSVTGANQFYKRLGMKVVIEHEIYEKVVYRA